MRTACRTRPQPNKVARREDGNVSLSPCALLVRSRGPPEKSDGPLKFVPGSMLAARRTSDTELPAEIDAELDGLLLAAAARSRSAALEKYFSLSKDGSRLEFQFRAAGKAPLLLFSSTGAANKAKGDTHLTAAGKVYEKVVKARGQQAWLSPGAVWAEMRQAREREGGGSVKASVVAVGPGGPERGGEARQAQNSLNVQAGVARARRPGASADQAESGPAARAGLAGGATGQAAQPAAEASASEASSSGARSATSVAKSVQPVAARQGSALRPALEGREEVVAARTVDAERRQEMVGRPGEQGGAATFPRPAQAVERQGDSEGGARGERSKRGVVVAAASAAQQRRWDERVHLQDEDEGAVATAANVNAQRQSSDALVHRERLEKGAGAKAAKAAAAAAQAGVTREHVQGLVAGTGAAAPGHHGPEAQAPEQALRERAAASERRRFRTLVWALRWVSGMERLAVDEAAVVLLDEELKRRLADVLKDVVALADYRRTIVQRGKGAEKRATIALDHVREALRRTRQGDVLLVPPRGTCRRGLNARDRIKLASEEEQLVRRSCFFFAPAAFQRTLLEVFARVRDAAGYSEGLQFQWTGPSRLALQEVYEGELRELCRITAEVLAAAQKKRVRAALMRTVCRLRFA